MAENVEKETMGLDNAQSEECGSKSSAVEAAGITLPDQDSEDLVWDTMAVLKKKDEDIRKIKDLLTMSMKTWVHDLMRRVELVKGEVKSARNMVLPTCIIIDELEEKGERHDELAEMVNTIMENVECVVKQIPVATNVIGLIMDHLRHLPQTGEKADSTPKERLKQEKKVPKAVSSSTKETEKPSKNSDLADSTVLRSDVSSGDRKSDVSSGDRKSEQKSIEPLPEGSAPDNSTENEKFAGEPPLQTKEVKSASKSKLDFESPENTSNCMMRTLEAKIAEMECTSMVIGDVMKYWITDVLEKIDYVTQEARLARKLVNNTNDKIQELPYTLPRESEIKDLINDLFEKVEDLVKQTIAVTTLVGYAVEQVIYMKGMSNFREELCATVLMDIPKIADEENPSRNEGKSKTEEKIAGNTKDEDSLSKEFPESADKNIIPAKNSPKMIMPRPGNESPQKKSLPEKTPEKNMSTISRKSPKKKAKNTVYTFTGDKNNSKSGDKNRSLDSASVGKDESLDSPSVDNNDSTDTIEKLRGALSESETDLSCDSCDTYFFEEEAFEVSMTNFAILDLIEPVTLRNYRRISDCD
ncbi:muscle M-line assembly protein unc-89-like [Palaemon carinicauda]|uniref:muscle M-line assembly protein unc-89-like n=1 Tax=Palaemon carinicauda TaxID=392227 RepID=UPI0035B63FAE